MTPYLYKQDYHGHGDEDRIGPLPSWIDCQVTEERNGEFYLEGTLPVGGRNVDELAIDRIIMCASCPPRPASGVSGDPFQAYHPLQPFRIRKVTKPAENVVQVTAHHVSYQLTENIVQPFNLNYSSVQTFFNNLLNYSGSLTGYVIPAIPGFVFISDIESANAIQINHNDPTSVRALLGGEGGIQDLFGGEFDWNGWEVYLRDDGGYSPRGRPTDIEIKYAKNMASLEFETNADGLITGYYGYYKGPPFKCCALYKDGAGTFAYERIAAVDLSSEFESTPTDQELEDALQTYMDTQHDDTLPTSITVTAVPDVLQNIFLCDQITVIHPEFKIKQTMKVVRTVYDPIRERYTAVTIGEIPNDITDTIAVLWRDTKNELFV